MLLPEIEMIQTTSSNKQAITNRRSTKLPVAAEEERLVNLIPSLKKRDVRNMKPDTRDARVALSEQVVVEWIHAFLDEIYRTDDFFKNKQIELINSFIALQDKFRIRIEKND